MLRAFRRAGIDGDRARGALVHGLRHTFATELADAGVTVYTLMKLLGHESMVASQRYVTAAGTETRTAAAQNKLYGLLGTGGGEVTVACFFRSRCPHKKTVGLVTNAW